MATTTEVLLNMKAHPGVSYPVLVPNVKGLEIYCNYIILYTFTTHSIRNSHLHRRIWHVQQSQHKQDCSGIPHRVGESSPIGERERIESERYVSTVITCPFEGNMDRRGRAGREGIVTDGMLWGELRRYRWNGDGKNCEGVDGWGTKGITHSKGRSELKSLFYKALLSPSLRFTWVYDHFNGEKFPSMRLQNHDTYGMAVANVMTALQYGIRTVDSSGTSLPTKSNHSYSNSSIFQSQSPVGRLSFLTRSNRQRSHRRSSARTTRSRV